MNILRAFCGIVTVNAINSCFSCNETSLADCETNGKVLQCEELDSVCEIVHRRRLNEDIMVKMGCKQHLACENNKYHNFYRINRPFDLELGFPKFDKKDQCRPKVEKDESVCRQCCDRDAESEAEDPNCGLVFLKLGEIDIKGTSFNRLYWATDQTNAELPDYEVVGPDAVVNSRMKMFKLFNEEIETENLSAENWMDPNDSRYPESKMPQGLRDFVHDPNDTRYQNPDKIIPAGAENMNKNPPYPEDRMLDPDYNAGILGWQTVADE